MSKYFLSLGRSSCFAAVAILIFLGFSLLATPSVSAQILNPCKTTPQATICTEPSNQTPDDNRLFGPNGVLTKVINLLSIILGVISVFVIIIAGVRYITSSSDSSSVNGAKNTLLYAVVSLAIAALSQSIVVFVLKRL